MSISSMIPSFVPFCVYGKGQHLMGVSVINAAEFFSGTNRPVNRAGRNSQFLFDLIQKIKGIVCVSVHFVDKCKNRNVAHYTDLEQLSCLRLHALASVNDHDSGICCQSGYGRYPPRNPDVPVYPEY